MATANYPNQNLICSERIAKPNEWEKGAVTAEFATALPAVMTMLAVVIALGAAFGAQFRVSDAARTGARLSTLGVEEIEVRNSIVRMLGGEPNIYILNENNWTTVRITQSIPFGSIKLAPVTVSGSATAWREP